MFVCSCQPSECKKNLNPVLFVFFKSSRGTSCNSTAHAITMSGPETTSAPSIPLVLLEFLNLVFIELPTLVSINTVKMTNVFSHLKKIYYRVFYEF